MVRELLRFLSDKYTFSLCPRVKAGLKLHQEADKREVQQSVHLLQDPQGIGEGGKRVLCMYDVLGWLFWYCISGWIITLELMSTITLI